MVPPGASESLGVAINQLLADPVAASRQAAAVRDSLCVGFDWAIVAGNYANALKALVAGVHSR
jgi:glycosyltransferase involved in cell wall biosynthesis